tara:strand:- start:1604 stop:2203 length:600 start_codon:yes stop_codon:yes gene_type:complete
MSEQKLLLDSTSYFQELVQDAMKNRSVNNDPLVTSYLTNLLIHYLHTENLFDELGEDGKKNRPTLAELFLRAMNSDASIRSDLLKKLGDTSLYIGGFFSESLNKKLIDVDYYVNMGETAFSNLAKNSEDIYAEMYDDFAKRFVDYMDVLTFIARTSSIANNNDLLKLYEDYQKTGSSLLKETLIEQGFFIEEDKKSIAQ